MAFKSNDAIKEKSPDDVLLEPFIVAETSLPAKDQNDVPGSSGSNSSQEFEMGTRSQVNGAAALFGAAGFLLGGPVVAVVAAAGSAHLAAKKDGNAAMFVREWGGKLNDYGAQKKEDRRTSTEKSLADKVTDELLKGAAWVENHF